MQAIRQYARLQLPFVRRFSNAPSKIVLENVSQRRGLLRISGDEIYNFLQGLITNDVRHLQGSDAAIFTMFLNKQGRVLFDTIIYKNDDKTCFIECDQSVEDQLKKHLMLFRVRKKISIDVITKETSVWAGFRQTSETKEPLTSLAIELSKYRKLSDQTIACIDPRLSQLGMRLITPNNLQIKDFQNIDDQLELSTDQYNYDKHRYILGVSEGAAEIPPTKIFPFEANCDYLNGISFHKGCYLGQEFTARTYHTGVIRKRIMPITMESDVQVGYDTAIINEKDQLMGKVKGAQGRHAIGSLKVDQALATKCLKIGNVIASTWRPSWWPQKSTPVN